MVRNVRGWLHEPGHPLPGLPNGVPRRAGPAQGVRGLGALRPLRQGVQRLRGPVRPRARIPGAAFADAVATGAGGPGHTQSPAEAAVGLAATTSTPTPAPRGLAAAPSPATRQAMAGTVPHVSVAARDRATAPHRPPAAVGDRSRASHECRRAGTVDRHSAQRADATGAATPHANPLCPTRTTAATIPPATVVAATSRRAARRRSSASCADCASAAGGGTTITGGTGTRRGGAAAAHRSQRQPRRRRYQRRQALRAPLPRSRSATSRPRCPAPPSPDTADAGRFVRGPVSQRRRDGAARQRRRRRRHHARRQRRRARLARRCRRLAPAHLRAAGRSRRALAAALGARRDGGGRAGADRAAGGSTAGGATRRRGRAVAGLALAGAVVVRAAGLPHRTVAAHRATRRRQQRPDAHRRRPGLSPGAGACATAATCRC